MNSAGVECSGNGDCDNAPLSGRKTCNCYAGFAGYTCNLGVTALAKRKEELRTQVDEEIRAAGVQAQELDTCLDEEKPVLCPDTDAVAEDKKGTCVATRKECGDVGKKEACKADET